MNDLLSLNPPKYTLISSSVLLFSAERLVKALISMFILTVNEVTRGFVKEVVCSDELTSQVFIQM